MLGNFGTSFGSLKAISEVTRACEMALLPLAGFGLRRRTQLQAINFDDFINKSFSHKLIKKLIDDGAERENALSASHTFT